MRKLLFTICFIATSFSFCQNITIKLLQSNIYPLTCVYYKSTDTLLHNSMYGVYLKFHLQDVDIRNLDAVDSIEFKNKEIIDVFVRDLDSAILALGKGHNVSWEDHDQNYWIFVDYAAPYISLSAYLKDVVVIKKDVAKKLIIWLKSFTFGEEK